MGERLTVIWGWGVRQTELRSRERHRRWGLGWSEMS